MIELAMCWMLFSYMLFYLWGFRCAKLYPIYSCNVMPDENFLFLSFLCLFWSFMKTYGHIFITWLLRSSFSYAWMLQWCFNLNCCKSFWILSASYVAIIRVFVISLYIYIYFFLDFFFIRKENYFKIWHHYCGILLVPWPHYYRYTI